MQNNIQIGPILTKIYLKISSETYPWPILMKLVFSIN
jgi:hypothetical protein